MLESHCDRSKCKISGCKLYKDNKDWADSILSICPIGKEKHTVVAFFNMKGNVIRIRVEAGCFDGTLAEFAETVIAQYGDNRAEYDAAIRLINAKSRTIQEAEGGK